MTLRTDIRAAFIQALIAGQTTAGKQVYGPRDWPTALSMLPVIIVGPVPHERAVALIKGPPSYETRAIIPVSARVAATSIEAADAALEALIGQIKTAVFSWLPFQQLVEQVASVETRTVFTSESSMHIGEAAILFECEFPEFYAPAQGVPITAIQATINEQTTGLEIGSFEVLT